MCIIYQHTDSSLFLVHSNLISTQQNFRLFKTGRVCRQRFYVDENCRVFQKGKKTVGTAEKEENCSLFSPFPSVFSKDLHCQHVKTTACLGKG